MMIIQFSYYNSAHPRFVQRTSAISIYLIFSIIISLGQALCVGGVGDAQKLREPFSGLTSVVISSWKTNAVTCSLFGSGVA